MDKRIDWEKFITENLIQIMDRAVNQKEVVKDQKSKTDLVIPGKSLGMNNLSFCLM